MDTVELFLLIGGVALVAFSIWGQAMLQGISWIKENSIPAFLERAIVAGLGGGMIWIAGTLN